MCQDRSSPYAECLHSNTCKNAVRVSVGTGLFSARKKILIGGKMEQARKYNADKKNAASEYLQKLKNVSIIECETAKLQDIRDVKIDSKKRKEERLLQFLSQMGNPYCFKVGDVAVKVSFAKEGASFQETMELLLKNG